MSSFLSAFLLLTALFRVCASNCVTDAEWSVYKMTYAKVYPTVTAESQARLNYAVNKDKIATHNFRSVNGLESYRLAINQFSDLGFLDFTSLFPPTIEIPTNAIHFTVPNVISSTSFSYLALGFNSPVQDQGIVCNSGWAYASTTAIQIYNAAVTGILNSVPLSAQNFIDCAGAERSCSSQVSQVAFDYLCLYNQRVHPLSTYPNRPTLRQQMCIFPGSQANSVSLTAYSNIVNGNDSALQFVVNYMAPVVIKFNPGTFEFMHYKEGIFSQPVPTTDAAHYMTVVGFGTDITTGFSYWLLQNSFGTTWGELGFIRIQRNPAKSITNAAIFPFI